jgi:hypothetical protein
MFDLNVTKPDDADFLYRPSVFLSRIQFQTGGQFEGRDRSAVDGLGATWSPDIIIELIRRYKTWLEKTSANCVGFPTDLIRGFTRTIARR